MLGQKIIKPLSIDFPIATFSLYAISITAHCQSGKLFGLWGGENLRVEIDDIQFREIPPEKKIQMFDIPPAWNGTALQGRAKTIIFLLPLDTGTHTLKYIPQPSATIEQYSITPINDLQNVKFELNNQAEDGDRRPWYTFALIDIPLHSLSVDITVNWHWFDGDDAKLIVDGQIQKKPENKRWKDWYWHATTGQVFSGAKREEHTFQKALSQGIHYIEFWADRTPMVHTVTLNLGEFTLKPPKRVPTVDDPMWTGDFSDDPDQIILARALFGEARDVLVPDEARIAIGWVIRHRVESNRWPDTYWEVIIAPFQFSSFTMGDPNRLYVENPLHKDSTIDKEAWEHANEITRKVIDGKSLDPTNGANHYYDDSISAPPWAKDQQPTLTISYVNTYGKEASIFFFKL